VRESAGRGPILGSVGGIISAAVFAVGILCAADSDLSTVVSGPTEAYLGQKVTITVNYANAGPETAGSAYVNAYIPSGVLGTIGQLTQEQWDALQASAIGSDSLGNFPRLFEDWNYCEHLHFQVQRGEADDGPVAGLDSGVTGAFGFELEIPMEPPTFGRMSITEPPSLAQTWRPAVVGREFIDAADLNRFARGMCDLPWGPDEGCNIADDACFGPRISAVDPIDAVFELVNDGVGDPTDSCDSLIGFTAGRIAVMRRGTCDFAVKAANAE
jgi:hypothetical protein